MFSLSLDLGVNFIGLAFFGLVISFILQLASLLWISGRLHWKGLLRFVVVCTGPYGCG